ncbi:MAG TPA: IS1380 family transposase [Geminicoccaceae bacterium]|nr:IS1380 family transposase [Geminicoccaceae bacterium]
MAKDAPVLPGLSPVSGKPIHAAFDGGRLTSDAGVLVLAEVERRLGIAERLARCLADPRDPGRVHHTIAEMIRFRVLLIAAGYPDANDCDALRTDPAFKLALGRLPESGADLCSQPTMSRLENLPGPIALKRMMAALVELFCDSFAQVPRRIVLDMDDTEDRVHGRQQLALFHAHYDGRCFLPIHVYEALTGKPVAVILRPGKTPDGAEVARVLRHVIRRIRARWPRVEILVRGDSHYGRPEAMSWCERHRVGYVFGLAGNKVLLAKVADLAEDAALGRVAGEGEKVRRYGEFRYAAGTWGAERRVIARVEASARGTDSRFIVTNVTGAPRWLYAAVYCARGQAENLVKAHKLHLASDRTSCTRATANQFRLMLHTAAYWLLHTLRGLAPKTSFWRAAQFDTLRLALIKVAGRVTELATRIKVALPSCYPYRNGLTRLAARAVKLPP